MTEARKKAIGITTVLVLFAIILAPKPNQTVTSQPTPLAAESQPIPTSEARRIAFEGYGRFYGIERGTNTESMLLVDGATIQWIQNNGGSPSECDMTFEPYAFKKYVDKNSQSKWRCQDGQPVTEHVGIVYMEGEWVIANGDHYPAIAFTTFKRLN